MTEEMMNLRTLPEKSTGADLRREMIGSGAHWLMELEVDGLRGGASRTASRPRESSQESPDRRRHSEVMAAG